jgi:hypothetical protein
VTRLHIFRIFPLGAVAWFQSLPISRTQILPSLLIAIDITAGIIYLINGDVRKFIYWEAAAVLSSAVTF